MAKLTFLLGLCGSGKTFIAERLATQTGAELFSDFLQDHSKNFPALVKNLSSGVDCIIDEWIFYSQILADLVNVSNLNVEWICFVNDRASADWNVVHRTNKADIEGHLRINEFLSDVYQYPAQAQILKITRIDAG
ncbi:MAG TPA: hypothetical protein VFS81_17170 [Candidatus Binatia bacterium]|nr:hypothetical protein [Candidatus Binatia bacterium]